MIKVMKIIFTSYEITMRLHYNNDDEAFHSQYTSKHIDLSIIMIIHFISCSIYLLF